MNVLRRVPEKSGALCRIFVEEGAANDNVHW
jgi:hypothetical protein